MNNEIEIIQGDSFEATLTINGLTDLSAVSRVCFASDFFGISKPLTQEGDNFVLRLTPSETIQMKVGISDFDITLTFYDDNVATVIYRDKIRVLPKVNKCNG